MMKTKLCRITCCTLLLLTIIVSSMCIGAAAASSDTGVRYTNPDTGYEVRILDDIDLLTEEQEVSLVQDMAPITEYGNIVFWSTDVYAYDEVDQAKQKRYAIYRYESSGIFVINTASRRISFQSDGRINSIVNASYARSVTDNVSKYASSGDYYTCAKECFSQIYTLMQGNRIAEPMKYISYVVISLMLAFVIVVGIVFGKHFNPLVMKNKEKVRLLGQGYLFTAPPNIKQTGSEPRGWVTALLLILRITVSVLGAGGGSSSSGGGGSSSSGGGGSGGSSSF